MVKAFGLHHRFFAEYLMLARFYLLVVGLLYLGLALWCAYDMETTSKAVGFQLVGGSGQSEFFTVYGGLEFGLALVLMWPLVQTQYLSFGVVACTLIHGSLVAFRSLAFVLFQDLERMTYQLAVGEWVIFLLGLLLCWQLGGTGPIKRPPTQA